MKFDFEAFWNGVEAWFLVNGIRAILIVVATIVLLNVIGVVVNKVRTLMEHKRADLESKKRAGTLAEVLRWALRVVLITVAFMLLLEEFHIDIKPMLAAAGVAGIAIGFGAQNLVQDFFAGFFILIEDQIRVGDVVKVNDQSGLVEKITLRMVVLRDYAGSVIYVRNGKIDVVTNMTKDYSYAVFNVSIAYREDVDQVTRVLKGIDDELRNDPAFKDDILAPLEVAGLDSFGDSAIVIKARTMTKPIQQWRIGREFNRRMKKKFDELNIEIPFPHQTIYFGQDKKGEAPPLKVAMENSPVK